MVWFFVFFVQIIYLTVLYFVVMFLIPLVLLVILNYKLMTALQRTRRKRETLRSTNTSNNVLSTSTVREQANSKSEDDITKVSENRSKSEDDITKMSENRSKSEDDITKMLIVVVLVFVVCQTPALITQGLIVLMPEDAQHSTNSCPFPFFFMYERLSDLMVVANSSLNFVVYCLCSPRFRTILISLVRCPGNQRDSSSRQPGDGVSLAPRTQMQTSCAIDQRKEVELKSDIPVSHL